MSGQESTGRFTNYFLAQKAAERIRWSAEQWTANGPIAACTEGDFAELLGAVGKAILDPGMTNMLYFLACASSGKEKAHMLYRLLRARVWYEQLDEDVLRPYHEKEAAELTTRLREMENRPRDVAVMQPSEADKEKYRKEGETRMMDAAQKLADSANAARDEARGFVLGMKFAEACHE